MEAVLDDVQEERHAEQRQHIRVLEASVEQLERAVLNVEQTFVSNYVRVAQSSMIGPTKITRKLVLYKVSRFCWVSPDLFRVHALVCDAIGLLNTIKMDAWKLFLTTHRKIVVLNNDSACVYCRQVSSSLSVRY